MITLQDLEENGKTKTKTDSKKIKNGKQPKKNGRRPPKKMEDVHTVQNLIIFKAKHKIQLRVLNNEHVYSEVFWVKIRFVCMFSHLLPGFNT